MTSACFLPLRSLPLLSLMRRFASVNARLSLGFFFERRFFGFSWARVAPSDSLSLVISLRRASYSSRVIVTSAILSLPGKSNCRDPRNYEFCFLDIVWFEYPVNWIGGFFQCRRYQFVIAFLRTTALGAVFVMRSASAV